MDRFSKERDEMVSRQLEGRGLQDQRVLAAMRTVPRHLFVSKKLANHAYRDMPLTIGHYQSISQPYMVALMCELLDLSATDTVLEVGTGSGYAAAVLSELCGHVVTVERIPELAKNARVVLGTLGCDSIEVHCVDGTVGFPGRSPYDAILVSAGAPAVPEGLKQQLKSGGRLVIPVGNSKMTQDLLRIRRHSKDKFETENHGGVAFVPLVGKEGWSM
ncbi:protein-L-isoaspartate(D-aspartate) O-methyltransferase [Roseibium sp. HPY-6]|uniref:protein-L-isoaspartate(D-aspartate) O-methyltransferase n=1 Tax=Roseibium sp. HPY-6 TaxID=3229852 RepID=UPI00338D94E2